MFPLRIFFLWQKQKLTQDNLKLKGKWKFIGELLKDLKETKGRS